ncbi:aldehyde dehydrogenase [Bergeriella denitrificans]|uniref:Putative succinate-semialdehyde dehydrogenase n=1 Tax=Bergeriella denitrificans TaxID=494 RepID=A0A378UIN9_BERDE|nr:aldehyde dehydrogenase [Bergeriella denitrificans]STZ76593.1 putative succinate-semialdehyde dehydrogenase [Bergeriella denitrificans]
MNQVNLFINGQSVPTADGRTFERIGPLENQAVTVAAAGKAADADAAVDAAAKAFPVWSALPPGEKRNRLLKAADLLASRAEAFVRIGIEETGSSGAWYGFNVHLAANMLRDAAGMVTQIQGNVIPSDIPGRMAMALRVPCGVVVGMAPWNAPVILATRALAMPLACGNTVVLKASENCPATHELLVKTLNEAGLGDGVVNLVTHSAEDAPEVVSALIAHPAVKRVNFTGSTHVGKIIAKQCAEYLKPVVLELGGKAPVIVCEDADLDEAANAVAFGAFFNQGQICMSTERVLVHESVADDLIGRLKAKIDGFVTGDPRTQVHIAHVESKRSADRILSLVRDAEEKGAKAVTGYTVNGTAISPVLLDGITPEMALYTEESFGPVCTLERVKDDDEAVEKANASVFGLSAAVFSRDIGRAMGIARRIESGICHINSATVDDEAPMPFGGVKESGYGRFGSTASINEFTELRWITVRSTPKHYPI